ncbi:beta/gamma crystallin domain-containing protein [Actinospica sp.]|jgi:hypothetical protein|uniref:beta/gamma crystallin domain-containing protein n=1 Tax=Actinospica sp. TaxID=1872142 RepID=UPI002B88DDC2|nr:beta/gamma crystallin domain-containing protein [Actinospica sp.]HWG24363.1 beta/gamma crystallin domain-containing protein [Actinospica sp.]
MAIRIKALLGLTAAVMSTSALLPMSAQAATASPAISIVNCGVDPISAGYTILVPVVGSGLSDTCFANAGTSYVSLDRVYEFYTGNNVVQVIYLDARGNTEETPVIQRDQYYVFPQPVYVVEVTIF